MVFGISEIEAGNFYKANYSNGFRVGVHENPAVLAARLIREVPEEMGQRMNVASVAQRLTTMIRWGQFDSAFSNSIVNIGEKQFSYVLSGNSYSFGLLKDRFYKAEEIISCEEAIPHMRDFLAACGNYLNKPAKGYFDVSFPTFYVLGPADKVQAGTYKERPVIFPDVDIPAGDIRFIKAFQDNFVYWNFGVLDRSGAVLGRYAFDTREPNYFSAYDYSVQEARLFMKFNRKWFLKGADKCFEHQAALNAQDQVADLLDHSWLSGTAKGFVESVKGYIVGYQNFIYGGGNLPDVPQMELSMNGPARRPGFRVPNLDVDTQGPNPELLFEMYRLNLSPHEKYTVRTSPDTFAGKEVMVIEVTHKTGKKAEESRRYYFDWEQKAFIPHPPGQEVEIKGKRGSSSFTGTIKIPQYLLWRQWDDHPNRLIF